MSICLGVPIAILASGVLGLNMFAAVLGPDVPSYMAGVLGTLATGAVMGLGSSPAHEVIKALQRRSKNSSLDVDNTTIDVEPRVAMRGGFEIAPAADAIGFNVVQMPVRYEPLPEPALVARHRTRTTRNPG